MDEWLVEWTVHLCYLLFSVRPSKPNVIIPIVSSIVPLTVIIMVATAIGIIIWLVLYCRLKQRREELELEAVGRAFQLTRETWTPKKEPHKKEFPQEKLKLKRELGEGEFGIVYEGEAEGIIEEGILTSVAVKQLRTTDAMDDFFREITFMSKLEHDKVVCLLGVCTLQEPYAMIFEYMDLGDLCSFLRDAALLGDEKGGAILTQQQLVEIAIQVLLSVHLSILSIHPFIHPSIPSSIHPSLHPSIHSFIHPSILSSIHISLHPSIYISILYLDSRRNEVYFIHKTSPQRSCC